MKILVGGFFSLLSLAIAVFVFVYFSIDAAWVVEKGREIVRNETGRELIVEGEATLEKGWTPRIRAEEVRFENAPDAEIPYMFAAEAVELEARLLSLFFGPVIIEDAVVDGLVAHLSKDEEGRGNWRFADGDENGRERVPKIKRLSAKDGRLNYRGRTGEKNIDWRYSSLESVAGVDDEITTTIEGQLQGEPISLRMRSAPWERLRLSETPYPIAISASLGDIAIDAEGAAIEPLAFKNFEFALDISGDDLANLYDFIFVPMPETGPYALEGTFVRNKSEWRFQDLTGQIGDSDIKGVITVDTGLEPALLTADIHSRRIYLHDIAGLIGLDGEVLKGAAKNDESNPKDDPKKLFDAISDAPFEIKKLNTMDVDVRIRAQNAEMPNSVFTGLDAAVTLDQGVIKFSPLIFEIADGRLETFATVDASEGGNVSAEIRARFKDTPMSAIFSGIDDKTRGPLSARANLSATGSSPRDLVNNFSGEALAVMDGGQMSHLLIELIGLDIAESLGVIVSGDEPIAINCAVLNADAKEGNVTSDNVLIDTKDTIIVGRAALNLENEDLDVRLIPKPKDFSPLSLKSAIAVEGPLMDPEFFPDPLGAGADGFFEKVINAIATPIAGLLPPIDLGEGKDANCRGVLASAQADLRDGENTEASSPNGE